MKDEYLKAENSPMTETPQGAQAILRALHILKLFTDSHPEWSLRQIAETTQLHRTTAYRLLCALESEGMISQDSVSGQYRLGAELIILGARAQRANPLHLVSRPVIELLAQRTGEMVSIEVLEGDKTLIVHEVKGAQQRRMGTSVGNMWHAHTTSTGKVLLAYQSPPVRETLLSQPLIALTHATITDMFALHQELEQVLQQGYALAINELEMGFTEVAAPVFDYRGLAVAALSIGGSSMRLTETALPELITLVKHAALTISQRLGYRT